jgi:hypothetical protein
VLERVGTALVDRPAQVAAHVVPGIEDLVLIGRGGAGVVYKGRQPDLDREVAVKVVWPDGTGEADLTRWRREVQAMARLSNHPNILPVFDGGITGDGLPYLVMPYVPGGSLGDRLRTQGPVPVDEVVALGVRLAGALAAAHGAGVLHRDVKPDNVLLSPYGEPLLSDFGIARLLDATATATRNVHATVAYAAPEVLSGQPATEASDVYGLAATLHACLTGSAPFVSREGEALVALAVRVTREAPPDLRPTGVPPAVAEVLEQALAKDPARRIPTAAELRRRLEAVGVAVPPPVTPVPERVPDAPVAVVAPPPPMAAPARSNRAWWAVLVLVLAIAGAAVALLLVGDGDGGETDAATATTSAPPTTEDVATTVVVEHEEPTTTATTETTSTTTTTTPAEVAPAGDDVASAAEAYLGALAAGDFESAYAMTTPGFREAQPFDGYVDFWSAFDRITIVDGPDADEGSRTATVLLDLDGAREAYTLTFVEDDDGGFLVDGPRPR